ncbi:13248_t:CDS:1, partial [Acaulospora morrowiae]
NAPEEILEQLQEHSEPNTIPIVTIDNNSLTKNILQLNKNMIEDIKQLIINIRPFPILNLTTKDNLVFIENKEINLTLHSDHDQPINILLTIIGLLATIKKQTYITINIPFTIYLDTPSYINRR